MTDLQGSFRRALFQPALQSINFTYYGFTVHPFMYHRLGFEVQQGHVGVYLVPELLAGRAAAEYRSDSNAIILADDRNGVAMVHEATHAIADMLRVSVLAEIEEAAAYIASTLYMTHGLDNRTIEGLRRWIDPTPTGKILRTVLRLIARSDLHNRPGAVIDDNEVSNASLTLRTDVREVYYFGGRWSSVRHRYVRDGVRECSDACRVDRAVLDAIAAIRQAG